MNAADTSASSAIADWTPLTVVSISRTTAAIDTFISDVSTTSTNIAIASRMASRRSPEASSGLLASGRTCPLGHQPRSRSSRSMLSSRYPDDICSVDLVATRDGRPQSARVISPSGANHLFQMKPVEPSGAMIEPHESRSEGGGPTGCGVKMGERSRPCPLVVEAMRSESRAV
jgi:hypothetical protein